MRVPVFVIVALCVSHPAGADEFVDILGSAVWARKGAYACGSADDAAHLPPGFFSDCLRLPYAMRVKLIDTPVPATQVYHMRVQETGERSREAWFARDGLTNNPTPADFIPDPR